MNSRGHVCESCGKGTYSTYKTMVIQSSQQRVRYLRCGECGHKPRDYKWVMPLSAAPPQQRLIARGHRLSLKD